MKLAPAIFACLCLAAGALKFTFDGAAGKGSDDGVVNYLEIGSHNGLFFGNAAVLGPDRAWVTTLLTHYTGKKKMLNITTCDARANEGPWNFILHAHTLPCQGFREIMEMAGMARVDILSLDMEGAEFHFLNSMDASSKPGIVVVESAGFGAENDGKVRQLLREREYVRSAWDVASLCNDTVPTFHPGDNHSRPCEYPISRQFAERCLLGNQAYVLGGDGPQQLLPAGPPEVRMHLRCEHMHQAGEKARRQALIIQKVSESMEKHWGQFEAMARACSSHDAKFYSQGLEDMGLLTKFFCGRRGGTYVEIGALDGLFFSNTKMLEDTMNWTGVLIEANPSNAQSIPKNRPKHPSSMIFPMAVCPEGVGHLTFLSGGEKNGTGGVVDTMASDHAVKWHHEHANYQVPCKPIGAMLAEAGLQHVDFFSLDVEGAELAVLETMSWNITTCMFLVELDGQNATKDKAVRNLLQSKGYTRDPKSEWDLVANCQAVKRANQDCALRNELWLHESFEHCGVLGGKL